MLSIRAAFLRHVFPVVCSRLTSSFLLQRYHYLLLSLPDHSTSTDLSLSLYVRVQHTSHQGGNHCHSSSCTFSETSSKHRQAQVVAARKFGGREVKSGFVLLFQTPLEIRTSSPSSSSTLDLTALSWSHCALALNSCAIARRRASNPLLDPSSPPLASFGRSSPFTAPHFIFNVSSTQISAFVIIHNAKACGQCRLTAIGHQPVASSLQVFIISPFAVCEYKANQRVIFGSAFSLVISCRTRGPR